MSFPSVAATIQDSRTYGSTALGEGNRDPKPNISDYPKPRAVACYWECIE